MLWNQEKTNESHRLASAEPSWQEGALRRPTLLANARYSAITPYVFWVQQTTADDRVELYSQLTIVAIQVGVAGL